MRLQSAQHTLRGLKAARQDYFVSCSRHQARISGTVGRRPVGSDDPPAVFAGLATTASGVEAGSASGSSTAAASLSAAFLARAAARMSAVLSLPPAAGLAAAGFSAA